MLERPDLPDQLILSRLQDDYGLHAARLAFLPLGADVNTAVFRVDAVDETAYFLKLRRGVFDEISVVVPHFLHARGVRAIIPPLETRSGRLWAILEAFTMILYPFIEGRNGYAAALSEGQWVEFGAALRAIHAAQMPPALAGSIPRETFSPHWREMVKTFQAQVEDAAFEDPLAAKLAIYMKDRRAEISHMVERAGQIGLMLQARSPEFVLCHADMHAGNLLIGADALYIVDWDNPILAPRERDLSLVGGCDIWSHPHQEALFYQGYARREIDPMALAYYRYERIIQDIAAFCQQLLLTTAGGSDREQAYEYFTGQFLPGHEVDLACRNDQV